MRTIYRAARSFEDFPDSRSRPGELIRDGRFYASRADLLYDLPRNGVGVLMKPWSGH